MWTIQLAWPPRFHCGDTEPSLALGASEMIDSFFFYVHQFFVCKFTYPLDTALPSIRWQKGLDEFHL